VLKWELGFDGLVLSDWTAIHYVSGATYADQVANSVNAGMDMLMEPFTWQETKDALNQAIGDGRIPMSRIDDAVSRILRIKLRAGLFEHPWADRSFQDSYGSQAHRDTAREAVRKSLVLLKNDGVLPLSPGARIFVAGKNADDMGHQCGGWSLGWQGSSGDITPGTTILEGIRNISTGTVDFDAGGNGASGHDVAIVVIGETPYAEDAGDDQDLELDGTDQSSLQNVLGAGIPTVVVLVSGRPMMIQNYLDDWNAFVAAWLPGTEGGGVAEVLYGHNGYDFTGTLPVSWPTDISQEPINSGDGKTPLFEFGFGLSYQ
jgi:beta-glucosidase